MGNLTMCGASDDLIEFDGIEGADEFNTYEQATNFRVIVAGKEYITITAVYRGSWSFAVGAGEGMGDDYEWTGPIPARRWEGYSEHVIVEVPDGARLERVDD